MVYKITVTEINKAVVEVEADSYEAAREQVEKDYWKNPIVYDGLFNADDVTFE